MREIKLTDITREELWAKQRLSFTDIDYAVWERNKSMLHQFSKMNRNCTFVVDVYKCRWKGRVIIWNRASIPTTASNCSSYK